MVLAAIDPRTRRPTTSGKAQSISEAPAATDNAPDSQAHFAELPSELAREKSYPIFLRQLKDHLYRESVLTAPAMPVA